MRALASLIAITLAMISAAQAQDEEARAGYAAAIDAFEARDADRYFASFAQTLRCFYGQRSVPLTRVRAARQRAIATYRAGSMVIDSLEVVLRSPDRVVLLDRGSIGQVAHQKAILMVRHGDRFVIAGEGGVGSRCYAELLRSDVLDGVDPLASAAGIERAIERAEQATWDVWAGHRADLGPLGRGVLTVRVPASGPAEVACDSQLPYRPEPIAPVACDSSLTRCVSGAVVYLFEARQGRRMLLAVVVHTGDQAPASDGALVRRAARDRDRICELHDRLSRGDRTLASSDLWVLPPFFDGDEPFTHLCGDAALERGRRAVRRMRHGPLHCGELGCNIAVDSTSDTHVHARREGDRLALSVDGTEWILGDTIDRRMGRRIRTERCPVVP